MTCYLLILTLAAHTTILPVCWQQEIKEPPPVVWIEPERAARVA